MPGRPLLRFERTSMGSRTRWVRLRSVDAVRRRVHWDVCGGSQQKDDCKWWCLEHIRSTFARDCITCVPQRPNIGGALTEMPRMQLRPPSHARALDAVRKTGRGIPEKLPPRCQFSSPEVAGASRGRCRGLQECGADKYNKTGPARYRYWSRRPYTLARGPKRRAKRTRFFAIPRA